MTSLSGAVKRLRTSFGGYDKLLKTIEETQVQSLTGTDCIVTHSGTFHCDEALACALLKSLPEFEKKSICRTRDENLIKQGFIVVDVGATFSLEEKRFDHHQKTFNGTFNAEKTIKLSSAGLIYQAYGKSILANLLPQLAKEEKNNKCFVQQNL